MREYGKKDQEPQLLLGWRAIVQVTGRAGNKQQGANPFFLQPCVSLSHPLLADPNRKPDGKGEFYLWSPASEL